VRQIGHGRSGAGRRQALSHPDFDPVWPPLVTKAWHRLSCRGIRKPLNPAWTEGELETGELLFDPFFCGCASGGLGQPHPSRDAGAIPNLRIGVVELTASWVPSFLLHIDGASDFYTLRHGSPTVHWPSGRRTISCDRCASLHCRMRCPIGWCRRWATIRSCWAATGPC